MWPCSPSSGNSSTSPLAPTRPNALPMTVNQTLPSDPSPHLHPLEPVGIGKYATSPLGRSRPIRPGEWKSANQRFPSPPLTRPTGDADPTGNSVRSPVTVILQIDPRKESVNHIAPSGPATIVSGQLRVGVI